MRPMYYLSLLLITLVLVACSSAQASEADIENQWADSAHADAEARAFTRWNDDDPPEIPPNCAKCHSTIAYLDFHGANGTAVGEVSAPVPVGTTVECDVCHSELTQDKTMAIMPSGVTLENLGQSANCMECHQGRASMVSVQEALADSQADEDSVDSELSQVSLHNNPVGPTQFGTQALGGFEYEGQTYLSRYEHVAEFDTCIECHNAHTLQVDPQQCSVCHLGVKSADDLSGIRTSAIDFDGDGDTEEGLAGEIETLQEMLQIGLRLYSDYTEGMETIHFADGRFRFTNEAGDAYATWTPRMLKAAYNLHYSEMNEGHYAHHGGYIIQLLIDSLDDLGLGTSGMTRPE